MSLSQLSDTEKTVRLLKAFFSWRCGWWQENWPSQPRVEAQILSWIVIEMVASDYKSEVGHELSKLWPLWGSGKYVGECGGYVSHGSVVKIQAVRYKKRKIALSHSEEHRSAMFFIQYIQRSVAIKLLLLKDLSWYWAPFYWPCTSQNKANGSDGSVNTIPTSSRSW